MRVVITGAAGRIGNEIVEELSGSHDLCLLDCNPVPGCESIIADLSQYEARAMLSSRREAGPLRWTDAFEGTEIVVHLAEDPSPEATWQRVLRNNIQATWNVLQAAVRHRVRRVIYASSNFAMKALELELAPACYEPDGPKIGSDVPPRPITPYGIGKACGEITGRTLVDEKKLGSFIAVRIGWYHPTPRKTRITTGWQFTHKTFVAFFDAVWRRNLRGFTSSTGSLPSKSPHTIYRILVAYFHGNRGSFRDG